MAFIATEFQSSLTAFADWGIVMGKALYPIFTVFSLIISLGFLSMGFSFYSSIKDVEDGVVDCMKFDGAEQMKCIESFDRQAENLRKVARSVTASK